MLVLYVACALLVKGGLGAPFSASEKQAMLNKHNEYRGSEGASNMAKLVWDSAAEAQAQSWADKCVYKHSHASGYGENIYKSVNNPDGMPFVNAMYNEKKDYDHDSTSCAAGKKCGHYTAMIWATSNKLGCAHTSCSFGYFLVCNYAPPGNFIGKKPFKKGPAGSDCSNGFRDGNKWCKADCSAPSSNCICDRTCHNGGSLNSNSCKCSCADGYMGDTCELACDDLSEYCGSGWPASWCSDPNRPYVGKNCPKLCGQCVPVCTGKTCENGGVLSSSCDCDCQNSWSGNVCSVCNLSCKNGGNLNAGQCKCNCPNGKAGEDCGITCENHHAYCGASPGWPSSWCSNNARAYVKTYCPLMCGTCVPA